jgi:hypothetical protein
MSFSEDVSAAIASLGLADGTAIVDGLADPGALLAALEGKALVLRAAPELGRASETHGPTPVDPRWVGLRHGDASAVSVGLRGGTRSTGKVLRVELDEADEACCDAPSCSLHRRTGAVLLVVDEGGSSTHRLLVAEQRAPEGQPLAAVAAIASRLARFVGVPFAREEAPAEAEPLPLPITPSPKAALFGRFALRSEGGRFVLRDHESTGPRETAKRNATIGALLCVVAALAIFEAVVSYRAGNSGMAIGSAATFALFALAGYAFLGVASFSSRYAASSAPLCSVGYDRLVVLPWVSREGAVDLRPEGRFGAAIPLGEVRLPSVKPRGDLYGVEIDTDHGPIDAMITDNEGVARYWAAALARCTDEVRHPNAGSSARQRARQRARDEIEQAKA